MSVAAVKDHRPAAGSARVLPLDVLRGASVCLMIVVNTPGAGPGPYPQLVHATWFGFTLADLVFPTFLFAVGAALSFTLPKTRDHRAFLLRTGRRTAVIFALGFVMFWYPFVRPDSSGGLALIPIGTVRIMGVLQRIALAYGLAALSARHLPPRLLGPLCAALLLGYWGLLLAGGAPGAGLTPWGNAAARLDRMVLGPAHMYHGGARGYDPEGLLGVLPATVNVLGGYGAGLWLTRAPDRARAAAALAAAGAILCAVALLWSPILPISKRLWTSSFTLLTVGLDLIILAALVGYIDLLNQRLGVGFLEVFGRNPLVIYVFSELFIATLQLFHVGGALNPYDYVGWTVFQRLWPGPLGSLLCAAAYMLVCWVLGFVLDRRKIFIRI